ncbi:hypothetical protein [Rhabdochromatium marinum]|uniref:hypothetical protein n=1 Tax=Rhabdochromatium marinum TaxID=48729 RepID=UPI00190495DB|nr:hypothetical protein [Rhabdochromatium marinum]
MTKKDYENPYKVAKHLAAYSKYLKKPWVYGRNTLDFGCGVTNPLGIGIGFYLNGASSVISADISRVASAQIAINLCHFLAAVENDQTAFMMRHTNSIDFQRRLRLLDTMALCK